MIESNDMMSEEKILEEIIRAYDRSYYDQNEEDEFYQMVMNELYLDDDEDKSIQYKGCEYSIDKTSRNLILKKYMGEDSVVVIPSIVGEIGKEAFQGNPHLKKIIIPPSVEKLGENCFEFCESLSEIQFIGSIPNNFSVDGYPFHKENQKLLIFEFSKLPACSYQTLYKLFGNTNNMLAPIQHPQDDSIKVIIFGIPFMKFPECRTEAQLVTILKNDPIYIDFSILSDQDYFNQYTFNDKNKIINDCNYVMRNLFSKLSTEKIIPEFFQKIDYEHFIHNIKLLMDEGFTPDEVTEIIAQGNFGLLGIEIEDAFDNYKWLLAQKILITETMDDFFFDGIEIRNLTNLKEYYNRHKKLPELFDILLVNKKDDKKLQELRDRVTYISTTDLLEQNNDRYAKRVMQQDVFQSIIEDDKDKMKRIDNYFIFDDQPKQLEGIFTSLYRKMNGIDSNWPREFFEINYNDKNLLENFLNSLTSIKDWNSFKSKRQRAIFLRNEIVGRLLYADLIRFSSGRQFSSENELIREYREIKKIPQRKSNIADLLYIATKDKNELFTNPMLIKAMLKIDPYSFDALRDADIDKITKTSLELSYVKDADNSGYYISDENRRRYQLINRRLEFVERKDKTFIEYLNNMIGISMDNSKVVNQLEKSIKRFVQSNDLDELYYICNIFDFHLRSKKEYDVCALQGNDFAKDSKTVFDRNSQEFSTEDEMPRVLYCLFNLNKLSKHNYDLKVKKWDAMRLNNPNQKEQYFAAINRYRQNITLLDQNNISLETIKKFYDAFKSIPSPNNLESSANIVNDILSVIQPSPSVKEDIQEAVTDIIELYETYPEDVADLETAAKDQKTAYECKNLFAKYAMKRFGILTKENLISAIMLSNQDKVERFENLGYAVEVQKDENDNLVLACYCKGITDSFSIHLSTMFSNQEVQQLRSLCKEDNYCIAVTTIPDRLRISDKEDGKIDTNNCNEEDIHFGFNQPHNKNRQQLRDNVAYKNAKKFNTLSLIAKEPQEISSTKTSSKETKIHEELTESPSTILDVGVLYQHEETAESLANAERHDESKEDIHGMKK